MKILGYEVIRVIKGRDIYKEHLDSEFFVNDTLDVYNLRYLHEGLTTGEIENSTYYLIHDFPESEKRAEQEWQLEKDMDLFEEVYDSYYDEKGEEYANIFVIDKFIPELEKKFKLGIYADWQYKKLHDLALELIEEE